MQNSLYFGFNCTECIQEATINIVVDCEIVYVKLEVFFVCNLQGERKAVPLIPVTWSTRMREVIIRPYWEKSCSSSFWVMVLGSPLTYRLASRIEAELGRAYDTCKTKNTLRIHCNYETIVVYVVFQTPLPYVLVEHLISLLLLEYIFSGNL